jgi:very-short-patch-repair endonuclease
MTGRFVDYEAGYGSEMEVITQDDEYRTSEHYDLRTTLRPSVGEPAPQDKTLIHGPWAFEYSRLRQVEIFNRGLFGPGSAMPQPFRICLECGSWRDPSRRHADADAAPGDGHITGHLPSCTAHSWEAADDPRIVDELHLRARIQGDVIEIPLPDEVAANPAWIETLAQSLKLGMQLEYYVAPHELGSFVRRWQKDGEARAALVLYDTIPGGTGYLLRLLDTVPQLAARVARHLADCPCERACYRCLKEFWNQRIHHLLDKTLVQHTLDMLAAEGPGITLPPQRVRRRFESFLEAEFHALLEQNGLPLPQLQNIVRTSAGSYIMRADFVYEQQRLVVLTDGRAFHAQDPVKIVEDLDRRNALVFEGYRLLEFTYQDVINRPEGVIEMVRQALAWNPAQIAETLEDYAAIPIEAQPFVDSLCQHSTRFRRGGRIALAPGRTLETLAVDSTGQIALVLVDADRWANEGAIWQRDLTLHNQARLQGWRLVRLPNLWLHTGQTQSLLDRLTRP